MTRAPYGVESDDGARGRASRAAVESRRASSRSPRYNGPPSRADAAARHAEHHFAGGVHRVVAHQVAAYHAARRIRQSRVEVTPECIKLNSDRTPIK